MATLTYSPQGFSYAYNRKSLSPNYQPNKYLIKKGYGSSIGFGDPVVTLTGGNQGYIGPYAEAGTAILGVLVGLGPYYDTGATAYQNLRWYNSSNSAITDIEAWVIDDPDAVYLAQISGGPYTVAARGQNVDALIGTPNSLTGISTSGLDWSTLATTSTLPFRVMGYSTMGAPGFDPSLYGPGQTQPTNGYVFVALNYGASETTTGTGV